MEHYSVWPLVALCLLMAASMAIGVVANRHSRKGGFLSAYFLGNRGLGSWSMALTATVMSGGTFMGFPSLTYQYGWVLALWIASYMVVPLCTFAVLGKRMGQLSRLTGAITLPELLRERFQSPALGLVASGFMVFIMLFGLVAQFKAGAIILQRTLPLVDASGGEIFGQPSGFIYALVVFTLVVLAYTLYGGFLAAVWTDLFQSILMAIGVLVLFPLALHASGGLAAGTAAGIAATGPGFAVAPGADREFLPPGLLFSMFCIWSLAGMGQPATLVRLMAFRDTPTLRHAMFLLAVYNTLIYIPLVLTFICARAIFPSLERPDEVMPLLALRVASPFVAGIILAAPFGAVMATVSGYLVQISSAFVQDFYHRSLRPEASERTLRRLSYGCMIVIALIAAGGAVNSPKFLQAIIVFAGGSAAAAYLFPSIMAAFWPRATARGALASMLGGIVTVLALYIPGWLLTLQGRGYDPGIGEKSNFYPIYLGGVAPFVWALLVSIVAGIAVSLWDRPPRPEQVTRFFPLSARGK